MHLIDSQSHLVIFSSRHGVRVSSPRFGRFLIKPILTPLFHPCLCALTEHVSCMFASRASTRVFVFLWHKCGRFTAHPCAYFLLVPFTKEEARKAPAMSTRFRRCGSRSQTGNTHLSMTRPCASNADFELGPFRVTYMPCSILALRRISCITLV